MSPALFYRRTTELSIFAVFFGGLASLVHEAPWLENALDLGIGIAASLLVAAALILLAYRLQLLRYAGHDDRWASWGLFVVGIGSISTAGVNYANRMGAVPLPPEVWVVSEKEYLPPRPKGQEQWKLRLTNSTESHWIHAASNEWKSVSEGGTYQPKVLVGRLRLRFVQPPLP